MWHISYGPSTSTIALSAPTNDVRRIASVTSVPFHTASPSNSASTAVAACAYSRMASYSAAPYMVSTSSTETERSAGAPPGGPW